ncbi:MG(2+) chelatase family protein / ComM-related protein [Mucinivorans hirudinis]|uniref:MG(2+) chelatase family protein / ComM-related protein n=1 Tax=Mucinivorans hirudinis TaxID=1433126 RepID=A0A060R7S4_9BACT|nr:MG(2+) chelatase family protein / ComM-related protein [Mucinivorans hirudinis]
MFVKTFCSTVSGIDARTITVEVNCSVGVNTYIVGLPEQAVKESQQRIISAFDNNGLRMPGRKIVVNLAPADLRKEGSHYDLPIAVGILAASSQIKADNIGKYIILGELSLDGSISPIKGALPIAVAALKDGFEGVILPRANAREAAVVHKLKVYGVENIRDVIEILNEESAIEPTVVNTREEYYANLENFDFDFIDVKGQASVKRALEIAAAGGHNVLMIGSPGSGKSMLAKRMPTIMPPMTLAEALEATKIHSVAGKIGTQGGLLTARPFRAPHHIISDVALVGGGSSPMPGEISLAHNGILFLDELPEFNRHVLEVMRQPLEERQITIARSRYKVDYPANFMLIAAMNPCPCGYSTHPDKECTCSAAQIMRYMGKISGPLLDRIDIHIEVQPVAIDSMAAKRSGETSADVRARVIAARELQTARFGAENSTFSNSMMTPDELENHCRLDSATLHLLKTAMSRMGLSARAYDKILKVARTIADLAAADNIAENHVAEAISYRNLDREGWLWK